MAPHGLHLPLSVVLIIFQRYYSPVTGTVSAKIRRKS